MKIPYIYLTYKSDTPAKGYWDHGLVNDLLNGELWKVPYDIEYEEKTSLSGLDSAIIVFPARSQVDCVEKLNKDIAKLKWVVLFLTGDEEALFPVEEIKHDNIKIWVMSPRPGRHDKYRKLGTGYPPQALENMQYSKKELDYFFAGQITHQRRYEMQKQIKVIQANKEKNNLNGLFIPTQGFTQGEKPEDYYKHLSDAKVAYAPSGPETPDSFRLFEALEADCIPIADTRDPKGIFPDGYWTFFFGEEPPFPVITNYEQLQGYTQDVLKDWKHISNKVFSWWQRKKREIAYNLFTDLNTLGYIKDYLQSPDNNITVIIPSSPIKSHPSTEIIEQTISDIRQQLPDAEIIITFDGIREEQKEYKERYEEYIRRVLWKCNFEWHNVLPIVFEEHEHQARMMREALEYVRTPLILYVEHDAPITPDRTFNWMDCCLAILSGEANVIRFHHEALILPDHEHMMIGEPKYVFGTARLQRTYQWSQRPHLASVAFYRKVLEDHFHPDSRTMIEDVLHGVLEESFKKDKLMGWYNFRVWIYTPEDEDIKRSYHIDGRKDDPKFEMDIRKLEK